MSSCSNEDLEEQNGAKRIPLELSVKGIATKTIIDGTTLPEESTYGVFAIDAENGTNAQVYYQNGTNTFANPVYLTEAGTDYQVLAYYPYIPNVNDPSAIALGSIESQEDVLYANQTATGNGIYVNQENPEARLEFRHALSRITLRISKAEAYTEDCLLSEVFLNNVYDAANLNLLTGEISNQTGSSTLFQVIDSYLGTESVEADWVAYPMDLEERPVTLTMNMNGKTKEITLPATNWESGMQYVYNVTIDNIQVLIEEATITPWEEQEAQEETNVGEDDYRMARVGDIYYSDGTYSPSYYTNKTPIGIVFALTEEQDGDINFVLTQSEHGRIAALEDLTAHEWTIECIDEELPNFLDAGDENYSINDNGQVEFWPTEGAIADFNGKQNTQAIYQAYYSEGQTGEYEALYICHTYSTEGREAGTWYLPACGELKLLSQIQDYFGYECNRCYSDISQYGYYQTGHWTSTEKDAENAWLLYGGETINPGSKTGGNAFYTFARPVTTF